MLQHDYFLRDKVAELQTCYIITVAPLGQCYKNTHVQYGCMYYITIFGFNRV